MKILKLVLLFSLTIYSLSCKENQNKSIAKTENNNTKTTEVASISTEYTHQVVVKDLTIPWGFVFLPDQSMLITEKKGNLIHFKNGKKIVVKDLPEITVLGQGGLMDIELHPDYSTNGWIYLSYASDEGKGSGANTSLMRCKLKDNKLVEQKILYKASPNSNRGQHFGSRIEFDNDGFLYFSIGDRGNRDLNPQNINRDCGKVYRLHDDGRIPVSNPFIRDKKAKKAIFSYGSRNIQGMEKHPKTGEIWSHEHGPKGGDEINIMQSGKNYGWPLVSFGVNYSGTSFTENTSLPGMENPIHHWTPSIAPSGMAFVTSDVYPGWSGHLLVGSLKFQYLNLCILKDNKVIKEQKLIEGLGRVRSINQGPDGYIYVGVENVGIVKIIPKK